MTVFASGPLDHLLQSSGHIRDDGLPCRKTRLSEDAYRRIPRHFFTRDAVAPLRTARRQHPYRLAQRTAEVNDGGANADYKIERGHERRSLIIIIARLRPIDNLDPGAGFDPCNLLAAF